jgi:hypothetical protein
MSRPRKDPADIRGVTIKVRLTDEENRLFRDAARAEGDVELSTWIRRTLTSAARRIRARDK